MGEAQFGLVPFPGYLKNNIRIPPFVLVLNKVKVTVRGMPDDLFGGHEFSDLVDTPVEVLIMEPELGAQSVSVAFDLFGPPAAHVIDGRKDLFRALVD